MPRWTTSLLFHLALALVPTGAASAGDAQHLQVEHVATPVGVTASAPRFSWYLPGSAATRGVAYTQTVEVSQDQGFSQLLWRSPSSAANVVAYAGPALAANERYYWRVHVANENDAASVDSSSFFGTGPIDEAGWQGAQWIKAPGADTAASPQLRTTLTTAPGKTVAWATLAVAGLGLNDVYIDDQKLDSEMNASNSDYNKTLFYIVHDVTSQITAGTHGIGIVLGNGWYDTPEPDIYINEQATWRKGKMLRALLTVRYTDGTTDTKVTGTDWRTTASETTWSAPFGGDSVDLTKIIPHWSAATFDDSAWATPEIATPPSGVLTSQLMAPIRETEQVRPIGPPTNPSPHVWVYTLPKNVVGWATVTVSSPAGGTVSVDYDESINVYGKVWKALSRHVNYGRWQQDIYTVPAGQSVLKPRFSYKGFRYIQVSSPGPAPDWRTDIVANGLNTDLPQTGSFTTSDAALARLHAANLRSYLGNFVNLPTDCPTREKQGWGADAQVAIETGLYNFDTIAAYQHYFKLIKDGQDKTGVIPGVVPSYVAYKPGSPVALAGYVSDPWWNGAILRAWDVYRFSGDRGIIEDVYPVIAAYMRSQGIGVELSNIGDHAASVGVSAYVTGGSALYRELVSSSLSAKLLGKAAEAAAFDARAAAARDYLNLFYFDSTLNQYKAMPANGLSLVLGMEPAGATANLSQQILDRVKADNFAFTTGIIGTKYLVKALHAIRRDDVVYRMLVTNTAKPQKRADGGSFNTMLTDGDGSTIWEAWSTFQIGYALSRNHAALTSVDSWLYEGVAGITLDPVDPAATITIAPSLVGSTATGTFAEATTMTANGPVGSRWERIADDGSVLYTVSIPRGARAQMSVDATGGLTVWKQRAPLDFVQPHVVKDPADPRRLMLALDEGVTIIKTVPPATPRTPTPPPAPRQ